MSIITILTEYTAKANADFVAIRDRVSESAATANNDQAPTIDDNGRFHAPCDGYSWLQEVYPAGAFPPFPPGYSDSAPLDVAGGATGKKSRVVTTVSELPSIKNAIAHHATVTAGKTWSDGVSCYVYIQSPRKGLHTAISAWNDSQVTQKVAEAAQKVAEPAKAKGTAPTGRQSVTGVVLAIKEVQGPSFSYYDCGLSYKLMIELPNGATVYGSRPGSLCDVEVGQTVEFTATFEQADGDETHAFYKRPSKARIV